MARGKKKKDGFDLICPKGREGKRKKKSGPSP